VKIPNSKAESQNTGNRKIFVGRLSEHISTDDLREFFSKYGEVTDVFIPKPFRGFAFVTFTDPDVAQALCGEDYVVRHCSVHVSPAAPKDASNPNGGGRSSRSYPISSAGHNNGSAPYPNRPPSPSGDRRSDYYYPSGPVSPQAKMNRSQVWSSFPSNSMPTANSPTYGNPWNIGNGAGYHHVQMGADAMGLMTGHSTGRSMTPVPPNQPPPPPPSSGVILPTSVNSQSAAASATNQATVGMGALNLGSFNIGSLLNPALFAAAQAAILQTLAQSTQQSLQGGPSAADISSALLGNMPAVTQVAQPPPPPGSCAPAAWWPTHTTSVVAVPSSAVPPSAAVMTTMSSDMVANANGSQSGRPVPVWSQEEGWRK